MARPSGGPVCGDPAAYEIVAICVHKHILDECFLCARCAGYVHGKWRCAPCEAEPDSHVCYVKPILRLLDTAVVPVR
jgi:hypothetical protein